MNFRKAPATLMMMATIAILPILSTTHRAQAEEPLFHGTPPGTVLQPTEDLNEIEVAATEQKGELKFQLPAGSREYMLVSDNPALQLTEAAGTVPTSGPTSAQSMQKTVGFTLDPNLPPGNYEQDVDVVADRKLVQRFVLKITVRPKA